MRMSFNLKCYNCAKIFNRLLKYIKIQKDGSHKFYCCKKCAAEKPKETVFCKFCGISIEIVPSRKKKSKSGFSFCSRSCAAKENMKNAKRLGENHPLYVDGSCSYRKDIKSFCECCGEDRYYLLIVHHKDGNRKNNDKENKATLCFNCHATKHLTLKKDKIVVKWESLTSKEIENLINGSVA